MATYYRWRKSTIDYDETVNNNYRNTVIPNIDNKVYYASGKPTVQNGEYVFPTSEEIPVGYNETLSNRDYISINGKSTGASCINGGATTVTNSGGDFSIDADYPVWALYTVSPKAGTSQGYVYSTSSTAYPNGGVQDGYYYDQRTTVTSPTAPTGLTYPNPIIGTDVFRVSWKAAQSNTDSPIVEYEPQYQINSDGRWIGINHHDTSTSFGFQALSGWNSMQFRVRSVDSNGQVSDWTTGPVSPVIMAPGAPSVSAPSTAVSGESITVTWGSVSGATSYTVQRNTGGSWTQVYSGNTLTFSETVGVWDSLQYRVQAVNQAGGGSWGYSRAITVYTSPTLTVPQQVMQGQSVPVNWTAIDGASSYTLQRKANTDADWVQVYSGGNTTFSETAGTWTSVQYRVQAVFSGTPGGWAESAAIPVVSSSALVISGTDGDLGTVVNDIPYTISTDTGNQITATISVNSAVIFSGNVGTGAADSIPVLDLVNGEGTIVIEASVQASSGTVSAVRTWTYTKTLITFPDAGSVAQLTQEGSNIWPKTLAECVRLPGGKTLDQVTAFPCQVYTGSYVGTGTYGESNPNTLTFPFEPKFVFICARSSTTPNPDGTGSSSSSGALLVYDSPLNIRFGNNAAGGLSHVEWEGNSVSWYWPSGTYAAFYQLNSAGITYNYVAIG